VDQCRFIETSSDSLYELAIDVDKDSHVGHDNDCEQAIVCREVSPLECMIKYDSSFGQRRRACLTAIHYVVVGRYRA
jgi:hypothetical protein